MERQKTDMEKTGKKYFIFNTVFTVLQITLLVCANIINLMEPRKTKDIVAYFFVDIIIMQLFFVECCSSALGGLSYIKKLRNAMIWFDIAGIAASVILMVWSFVWGVFIGVEGAPFPKAFFVEFPSLVLLVIKTVVDGVIGISYIAHRKKKDR